MPQCSGMEGYAKLRATRHASGPRTDSMFSRRSHLSMPQEETYGSLDADDRQLPCLHYKQDTGRQDLKRPSPGPRMHAPSYAALGRHGTLGNISVHSKSNICLPRPTLLLRELHLAPVPLCFSSHTPAIAYFVG